VVRSRLPDQILALVLNVGHSVDVRTDVVRSAGSKVIALLHRSAGSAAHLRCARRTARLVEVIENAHNHGALVDAGDQTHAAAAAPAAQRVGIKDALD